MTRLPVLQAGSWFQFSTELDGVTFGFAFRWNEREGNWYVSLLDGDGNALVSGRKIVVGAGLFRAYRANPKVMQSGDVYVIDTDAGVTTGDVLGIDPGYSDLGSRVVLTYATDAELGI